MNPQTLTCYRCKTRGSLVLAHLWPYERIAYVEAGVVMRQCTWCGLEQNHMGDDEVLDPAKAASDAPKRLPG